VEKVPIGNTSLVPAKPVKPRQAGATAKRIKVSRQARPVCGMLKPSAPADSRRMQRGIGSDVERFGQVCFDGGRELVAFVAAERYCSDPIAKLAPAW